MNSVMLENKGQYRTSINGNVIDEAKWNVDYDGKMANLEAEKNGETVYMKLTNDQIMKIMGTNASPYSIEERLLYDRQHRPQVSPILLKLHDHPAKKHKKHKTRKSKSRRKHKSKKQRKSKSSSKKPRSKSHSKSRSKSNSSKTSTDKQTIPDYMRTIY